MFAGERIHKVTVKYGFPENIKNNLGHNLSNSMTRKTFKIS
jgi:hypothetical protein